MSEAHIVQLATDYMRKQARRIAYLEAQLEAARGLTQSLEEEAHACPNQIHHAGWWTDPMADM